MHRPPGPAGASADGQRPRSIGFPFRLDSGRPPNPWILLAASFILKTVDWRWNCFQRKRSKRRTAGLVSPWTRLASCVLHPTAPDWRSASGSHNDLPAPPIAPCPLPYSRRRTDAARSFAGTGSVLRPWPDPYECTQITAIIGRPGARVFVLWQVRVEVAFRDFHKQRHMNGSRMSSDSISQLERELHEVKGAFGSSLYIARRVRTVGGGGARRFEAGSLGKRARTYRSLGRRIPSPPRRTPEEAGYRLTAPLSARPRGSGG